MTMTSKQRFVAAFDGKVPDRMPVTTHHVMPYFLDKYMDGISYDEFFEHFGMDAIRWADNKKPDTSKGDYFDPDQEIGLYGSPRVLNDNWRIETEDIPDPQYKTTRFNIVTPKGILTTILQGNDQTHWISEPILKNKSEIDLIAQFATTPLCDVDAINKIVDDFGDRGIVRGTIITFDIHGQPGCWQDACCLYGVEKMMMATFDDPKWVHEFLTILQARKLRFIESLKGAKYDILEHGGGDASTTVISPKLFDDFVAPYDSEIIRRARQLGQRVAYHTCGGMMPILESLAGMEPNVLETFTPPEMGGDVDLAEAKKRIGDRVCMIGGFDQFHHFIDCTEDKTRSEVRKCFEQAGANGGFILCPSDHFFDADVSLIEAFADEARKCTY